MTKQPSFFDTIKSFAEQVAETATAASTQAAHHIDDAVQQIGATAGYAYAATAQKTSKAVDYLKEKLEPIGEDISNLAPLDEVGRKIASLGAPAIAFAVAASVAGGMGLAGGAVVTTALAMLGGPFGMIGGLITLGILTVIADAVGKYGIEAVLKATFEARRQQGMDDAALFQEIDGLWLSDEIKWKIKNHLHTAQNKP